MILHQNLFILEQTDKVEKKFVHVEKRPLFILKEELPG